MLPREAMYPYTAKVARERGELELWRANFRTNCACAGAIELAIRRDFDGMHLGADCVKSVIDQYGYKRVGFVLANTLQEQSYDGRYHETNKQWSRSIFVPEDGGHRHTFLINSHPAVLDGFVSEYRAELAKLHLFGAEHCEPNSGEQDFTGRVLILSPDTLRESYWQPENQLWLALSGFGCRPHAHGRSVLCTCLGDSETTRWNRSEFVGIIRDECIPDWAAEKLAELQHGRHEMTMKGRTQNENCKAYHAHSEYHGAAVLPAVCGGLCRRQRRCSGRSGEHLDGGVRADQVGGQQGGIPRY